MADLRSAWLRMTVKIIRAMCREAPKAGAAGIRVLPAHLIIRPGKAATWEWSVARGRA
jgi:hypothetical protein